MAELARDSILIRNPRTEVSSLATVARRTGSTLVRHAPAFVVATAVSIGVSWLVVLAFGKRESIGIDVAAFIVSPILSAFVTAVIAARERDVPAAAYIADRVIDRAWAVIVVDFIATLCINVALSPGDVFWLIVSGFMLALCATLALCDVIAVVDDGVAWWRLPTYALFRSVAVILGLGLFGRAIVALGIQLGWNFASQFATMSFSAHKLAHAEFWGSLALGMIGTPVVQTFLTVIYLDAVGGETQQSSDSLHS